MSYGCNGIEKNKAQLVEFVNVSCACPDPKTQHKAWLLNPEPVVCDQCKKRADGNTTEQVCGHCKVTVIGVSDQLCQYCSFSQRRCYGCGVDETRWQKLQRRYKVNDALKEKFEAKQLTEADLLGFDEFAVRNTLAYQRGEESLGWE